MSDRRIYRIDYQVLDAAARDKGVNPLDLLGVQERAKSVMGGQGLASLDTLRTMVSRDPFCLIEVDGLGLDTAKSVYFGLSGLSERPMSAHLKEIARLAEPRVITPKPKREPRLLGLAQPFYENGGGELDGQVTMRNLIYCDFIASNRESEREFGQGWRERIRSSSLSIDPFEEDRKTEHLVPDRLIEYMGQRNQYEKLVIDGAFRRAENAGLENVGAIRSAQDQELDKLGERRKFFLRVGFGVVVDGKVVPPEQYMLPSSSSV